ncbi:MAG TPA: tetratricopeptide repeat protein [Bacteroidetes bacterium]|nr:tetratricopeptide repeat protein [Bacteroidota bacterium]
MKKFLFSLIALFFITTIAYSQTDPKKALSKAGRALSAYHLNPTDNDDKLEEAKNMIETAIQSDDIATQAKAWLTRGEIYIAYADKDMAAMMLSTDPGTYVPKYPDAPYIAAESFEKALSVAKKKYEIKDALKGLKEAGNKLNQIGNYQINVKDYAGAYKSLKKVYDINNTLKEKGSETVIDDSELKNQKYVMAYCADASNQSDEARRWFKELYEEGTDEPSVYAKYFNILLAEKDDNALKVLEEGRTKFPDNTEILFAEINYYINLGDLEKLKSILQKAIEAEPNNPSVRTALGNVYMNLFTEEYAKNGDSELANDYFKKSLDYFNQAIELDAKQFDALYSIGSLYYNKAVEIIKVANDLPLNEAKKYDELSKQANELMETALPYFQKAESINPNDNNTLIALSEIYARKNDFEKSKEFKKRLEILQSGGTNKSSYFNK